MFKSAANILDSDSVQVCRLCLVEEEDLVYLFNSKGYQGFRLSEIVEDLLQEEVSKEDGLPWTICKGCVSKVMEFKHYKSTCIQSKLFLLTKMANSGSEFNVKEEVNADDPLTEAVTNDQEILRKDKITCMRFSSDASVADPLDLIDIKEDADSGESCSEVGTYNQKNHQEYGSLDVQVSKVVCLPLVNEELCWDKEEVDPRESLAREETHGGENLVEDVTSISNNISETKLVQKMCGAKEEDDSSESLAREETQGVEDLAVDESQLISVASVISIPPWVGNVVDGSSMPGGSPKMCEKIVSGLRNDDFAKEFERNTSLSGPGEHSLRNNFSGKKEQRVKSGDYVQSAIKLSDMMPSELRHLNYRKKQLVECIPVCICCHCGVKFTDKNKLVIHVRGHFLRNIPSTSVMTEDSSVKFFESRTTGIQSSKPFTCEMCGKDFKSKRLLSSHYVVHGDLKHFKCETCGKEFRRKCNLTSHSAMHSNLRPFQCETCGKGFKWKIDLTRHLVIHSGLRPYKCDTCGKGFTQKSYLDAHSVVHTGLRPFTCEICGKGFKWRTEFQRHSILHS